MDRIKIDLGFMIRCFQAMREVVTSRRDLLPALMIDTILSLTDELVPLLVQLHNNGQEELDISRKDIENLIKSMSLHPEPEVGKYYEDVLKQYLEG